ncbi:MAG: flagellar hook-basal body protein [Bacillus sp. (in: firmicutes)]
MLRGFYTAATGMIAQQRRTEMLTNNLANASTPGYKADQSSLRAFPEMLISHFGETDIPTINGLTLPTSQTVGQLNTGVYMQETIPAFAQGSLKETDMNTDIALIDVVMPANEGNGGNATVLFSVSNSNGETRYTRNGNFTLDQQGFLTTPAGHYVLDTNGTPIQLESEQFTIQPDGAIVQNGNAVGTIGIAYAENPLALVKEGDGLFRLEDGGELPSAFTAYGVQFAIEQGMLEQSNVDTGRTMTDMMTAYRAFEANQKVLQAYDRSLEKAVNEIGKV